MIIFIFAVVFNVASAQTYVPLAPLPGVTAGQGIGLGNYVNAIFKIGIGLAGVFAVLMIVIGGVQYIGGAANPSARSEAKGKITNAIFGLLLALSAWLILYIINPDLLKKAGGGIVPRVNVTIPTSRYTNSQYTNNDQNNDNTQNYGDDDINDQEGVGP